MPKPQDMCKGLSTWKIYVWYRQWHSSTETISFSSFWLQMTPYFVLTTQTLHLDYSLANEHSSFLWTYWKHWLWINSETSSKSLQPPLYKGSPRLQNSSSTTVNQQKMKKYTISLWCSLHTRTNIAVKVLKMINKSYGNPSHVDNNLVQQECKLDEMGRGTGRRWLQAHRVKKKKTTTKRQLTW